MRRSALFSAVVAIVSASALVQACAASGGEGSDDSTATGGDASSGGGDSQTIDGSPITADTSTIDGNTIDSGADAADTGAACVLTPPSNKCGIYPNCGCAGTTCDFVLDSGEANLPTACTPSVGAATGGQRCTVTTDCAEGLTCVNEMCHEFCANPGDPCTGIYSDCRNHDSTTGFNVCGIKCDLTSSTSCGTLGCVAVAAGASEATSDCEPVGTKTVGQSCTVVLDCAPGLNCVNTGSSLCKQVCVSGTSTCPGSVACASLAAPIVVDGITYGYCP